VSDIFPVLFAAHMLGDWVIQTDKQALAKMSSWRAIGRSPTHVPPVHGGPRSAVLARPMGVAGFVISATTHGFIDRRCPVRWLLR
jgi:hypothetical protein